MVKLDTWRFGASAALTFSILYTACALVVGLFPEAAVDFFNNWFHGLDLRLLKPPVGRSLTIGAFVSGLAGAAAVSFAVGAAVASFYNAFRRGGEAR